MFLTLNDVITLAGCTAIVGIVSGLILSVFRSLYDTLKTIL